MKKVIFTFLLTFVLLFSLTLILGAEAYYVNHDGSFVDADSDDIAYEFDISKGVIPYVFLHDESVTKIVIPDIPNFEDFLKIQRDWDVQLQVYALSDKSTKSNNLINQIEELHIHENLNVFGANGFTGTFMNMTGLKALHLYGSVNGNTGVIFKNNPALREVHFYGQNITISENFFGDLPTSNLTVIFHENATGTLTTGGSCQTLPAFVSLTNWTLIINPNIVPSNPDDTRLGTNWGAVHETKGWNLILAVPTLEGYSDDELIALKTSHSFSSRYDTVELSSVKEAEVLTYCQLGYDSHAEAETVELDKALGYFGQIKILNGCNKCRLQEATKEIAPLFTDKGYSISSFGSSYSITHGYYINKSAINEYRSYSEDFTFGALVTANPMGAEISPALGEDNVLSFNLFNQKYDYVDIKITDISEKHYGKHVVLCLYATDGDSVYYLDKNATSSTVIGELLSPIA